LCITDEVCIEENYNKFIKLIQIAFTSLHDCYSVKSLHQIVK